MSQRDSKRCENCAYVDKEGKGMWCPFHDLPVTTCNVCKNYLSEDDSPQWRSITRGLVKGETDECVDENFTTGDKVAFVITAILFGISIAWMIYMIILFWF